MSIINYKNRMIVPLMELEPTFGFEVIMNSQIQNCQTFMKLYRQVLLWH